MKNRVRLTTVFLFRPPNLFNLSSQLIYSLEITLAFSARSIKKHCLSHLYSAAIAKHFEPKTSALLRCFRLDVFRS